MAAADIRGWDFDEDEVWMRTLLVQCMRGEKSSDDDVPWIGNKASDEAGVEKETDAEGKEDADDTAHAEDKASFEDEASAQDKAGAGDKASVNDKAGVEDKVIAGVLEDTTNK